jgi:hypothetical protein
MSPLVKQFLCILFHNKEILGCSENGRWVTFYCPKCDESWQEDAWIWP